MSPMPPPARLRVRTCFLSDIHLGIRGCRADYLLDFLSKVECDTLYLVGDIVDLWSLKRRFLVLHGDEVDSVIRASPLLESLGNRAYALVLRLTRYVNAGHRACDALAA